MAYEFKQHEIINLELIVGEFFHKAYNAMQCFIKSPDDSVDIKFTTIDALYTELDDDAFPQFEDLQVSEILQQCADIYNALRRAQRLSEFV